VVPDGAEAVSLRGEPLSRPSIAPDELAKRQAAYDEARAAHDRAPGDVDAAIWHGRRLGYLNRFRDAVEVFGAAIAEHPDDARLYRHRGHRYITLRMLDAAIRDLEHAASLRTGKPDEIEPDGQPNPANIPTSTLHGNIYYHLGLAKYLKGDFAGALAAYDACMATATNDDSRVSTAYWQYLTLRRLERHDDAAAVLAKLPTHPVIIENHAYHRLLELYRGNLDVAALVSDDDLDRVTVGYGVAMWKLFKGDRMAAIVDLRAIVAGDLWPAFGFIAAEAELPKPR
jgi:tetratricopeptide (TPR) repeat protein